VRIFGVAVAAALGLFVVWTHSVTAQEASKGQGQSTDVCLACHNQPKLTGVLRSPHGVAGDPRTHAASEGCESCHGDSAQHRHKPEAGAKRVLPGVRFSGPDASPVAERNAVCLGCHESGMRMNWHGSQHAGADVPCSSCHTAHAARDPVLEKATQPQVCFACHGEQRAESFQFSHHPIREGKVVCSDCHNPHGSAGPKLLKELTINETCYDCHAEKRGPLLWEHEPVREDCSICHTPHGSTQARLLKERPPYLCQSCHGLDSHNDKSLAGQNLADGNRSVSSGTFAIQKFQLMARGCVNCHSQVHGSNSPGGMLLTR
jgi:DmsE family decaheme c-type cytochrome